MASTRRVKRRLKKRVLIILIFVIVILMFVFTTLVKGISSKDANGKESSKKQTVSLLKKSESKEVEAVVEEVEKVEKPVIVIDPAFGGEYAGSKGFNGVLQKDVNLDIALKVKKSLERYDDIEVFLTRESDVAVSYEKRISLIKDKKANVVVSIQQNTEGTGTATGIETYVLDRESYPDNDRTFGYTLQKAMTMYSVTADRGVMARNIDILKDSYANGAVGAVVYTGFITNEKESKNLTTDSYTEKLGEGIAQGILSYVDKTINSEKK